MKIFLSGFDELSGTEYTCQHEWDCFVQGGNCGVVFSQEGCYETAFFEAFPRNPNAFVRGEGRTMQEAEENCWTKLQRYTACPRHEFDACGYENGGGFCIHCGMFASSVIPGKPCQVCSAPTWFTKDKSENWYCEAHQREKPLALWTDGNWESAYLQDSLETDRILRRKKEEEIRSKLYIEKISDNVSTGLFDVFTYEARSDGSVFHLVVREGEVAIYSLEIDYGASRLGFTPTMMGFIRSYFLFFMEKLQRNEIGRTTL